VRLPRRGLFAWAAGLVAVLAERLFCSVLFSRRLPSVCSVLFCSVLFSRRLREPPVPDVFQGGSYWGARASVFVEGHALSGVCAACPSEGWLEVIQKTELSAVGSDGSRFARVERVRLYPSWPFQVRDRFTDEVLAYSTFPSARQRGAS
jgi:hypothetical protein